MMNRRVSPVSLRWHGHQLTVGRLLRLPLQAYWCCTVHHCPSGILLYSFLFLPPWQPGQGLHVPSVLMFQFDPKARRHLFECYSAKPAAPQLQHKRTDEGETQTPPPGRVRVRTGTFALKETLRPSWWCHNIVRVSKEQLVFFCCGDLR